MPRDTLKGINDYYDAVVIGSGMDLRSQLPGQARSFGSSSRASLPVRRTRHMVQAGGWAYIRHIPPWFSIRDGQVLQEDWTKEIANSIVQLKNIRFVNPQYDLKTTFDRLDFSHILQETFKIAKERVEDFFEHVRTMDYFAADGRTIGDLLEQFFPGRDDVKRLLLEPIAYANGSSLMDPAIAYGIVFSNFMKKGIYTFKDGTDSLIKKMVSELQNGADYEQSMVESLITNEKDGKHHDPASWWAKKSM